MTVSAEGRVENQKLNQTAALLSFGWVFGFQLDLLEKNLITLTRVTFTHIFQGVSYVLALRWALHGLFRQMGHFLTNMSNRVEHQKLNQTTAELSFGWVFGVQLGLRQTQALIKTTTIRRRRVPGATLLLISNLLLSSNVAGGTLLLPIVLVLISDCVCRRPSWTPKTQPNDSSAVVWLSFWCSTRLLMSVKKCVIWRRKGCTRFSPLAGTL